MLTVSLLILLVVALFSGVGLLFYRMLDVGDHDLQWLFGAFWVGWALVTGLLQVWHFFLPINTVIFGVVTGLSLAGWVSFLRQWKSAGMHLNGALLGLVCLPAFLLANQALYAQPYYDHGLYHLQSVKWANQFAIVPGLGNLQHRLAFNSSQYLLAALLNSGPLQGLAYYLTNTSPTLALVGQGLAGLVGWLGGERSRTRANLFFMLALPLVLWQVSSLAISGYAADIPVFMLQMVVAGRLLSLFETTLSASAFKRQARLTVLLLAAGMTVKLSFWFFAAAVGAVLAGVWFLRYRKEVESRTALVGWLAVAGVFLLPWLGRNALLSGYLLYPSQALALPVAWKMPDFLVNGISDGISAWARTYSAQLPYTGDWAWFTAWLARFNFEPRLGLALAGFLLLATLAYQLIRQRRVCMAADVLAVLVCALVSVAYWFVSAPSYRFAGAALWLVLIAAVLWAHDTLALARSARLGWVVSVLFVLLFFFTFPAPFSRNLSLRTAWSPPLEPQIAEAQQPRSGMAERVTDFGVRVHFPADPTSELCWDFPLPCTTPKDFFAGLRMFEVGNLQKGFYIVPSP